MKKTLRYDSFVVRLMRLSFYQFVLIIIGGSITLAHDGSAQEVLRRPITLQVQGQSLKKVLQLIEKQTTVKFLYRADLIQESKPITLSVAEKSLGEVLETLLLPNHLTFNVSDHHIILARSEGIPLLNIEKQPLTLPIKGRVSSADDGKGIPGANVIIKGTSRGTTTDVNGDFQLEVPDKTTELTFSFVGYDPQTVTVGDQFQINISLKADIKALSEVVVIGYGTQKKTDVTGAIASINSTAIARSATPDATGALQGRVPGAVIVKNVGKPGSGYSISIRGTSSIGGSSSPLFVIDGIPTTTGLNDLNPADVEKIDILKDASATAIYGSRGAKGVVIVTTKRGKSGKTTLSYDAYVGVKTPVHLPRMFNGPEYVAFRTDMFTAQGKDVSRNNATFFTPDQWANIDAGKFTNWPDLVLKNGVQTNHNVTASGGDDKTRFAISAGFLQESGNVSPEDFKRYSLRGNVDRQINDKWKAGLNLYLVQNLQDLGSSEALRSAYRLPPVTNPYDASGNLTFRVYGTNSVTNPVFDQQNELRKNRNMRVFGNLYVQVQPLAGLTLKSTISPNYSQTRNGTYYGPLSKQSLGGAQPTEGIYGTNESFTWFSIIRRPMKVSLETTDSRPRRCKVCRKTGRKRVT